MNVCIVGAGFAGLSAAKVLRAFGHEVTVSEKQVDVGGVWSASRRHPGLTTQNVRSTYAFSGRRVEIPLQAVVKSRGDKLWHEHIGWDQASVLVQIGLRKPEGLTVAGVETARQLVDKTLLSNTLMRGRR